LLLNTLVVQVQLSVRFVCVSVCRCAIVRKLLTARKHTPIGKHTRSWLRGPAVEHRSLADVLSLSCVRLVADG